MRTDVGDAAVSSFSSKTRLLRLLFGCCELLLIPLESLFLLFQCGHSQIAANGIGDQVCGIGLLGDRRMVKVQILSAVYLRLVDGLQVPVECGRTKP